jgi:hypothetical protein
MKNTIKITDEQIKAMQSFLSGLAFADKKQRQDLKLYYSVLSPTEIYVKYTSYSLLPDNGIESSFKILCIKPDGSNANCVDEFDNMNQRLEFQSNLIEVDLDNNGKLVFV